MLNEIVSPRNELSALRAYTPATEEAAVILSANESPFNLPKELVEKIKAELDDFRFNRYPDPGGRKLIGQISQAYGLEVESVILGNGSDELIEYLAIAYGGRGRSSLTFDPTFSMYEIISVANGLFMKNLKRTASFDIDIGEALDEIDKLEPTLIFICNPNNPTGNFIGLGDIERIVERASGLVVVDEAYGEFSDYSAASLMRGYKNLVVLRTFSKAFSLASLRIGYMLASKEVAENIQKVRLPFNTDAFSQLVARMVFENRDLFKDRIDEIKRSRDELFVELNKIPSVRPFPSKANFILFEVEGAAKVYRALVERGILVRDFGSDSLLKDFLRVTVGSSAENWAFLEALFEATSENAYV
ncbi:MAG: histidinol-phosphate transaminase [Actinomycetota bacterium]|nr:histidinol-phosphate transaminase [Actinomycetota bacterium]